MKKLLIALSTIILIGCNQENSVSGEIKLNGIKNTGAIQSFGTDKVIYINNDEAIIISNSGQIISKTNLKETKPIERFKKLKTSIPAHENDTLYARIEFIDDMIYYKYYITNGKKYGMNPYLISKNFIKLVDLPCQSDWIGDVNDKKYFSCSGKIHASMAIWEQIENYSLSTTVSVF